MGQCFSRLHGKHNISTAARTGIIPTTQEDQPNPTPTESDSTRAQSEEQFDPDATGNGKLHANPQTVDINTIKDEIFTALGNGMVGKKGEEIILPEVVEKIWNQNHHRKFYINQSWYKSEWDRNNFMDEMIQIMSILIRISFDQWSKFDEKFVHHGDRRDCNLPFALETLQEKGFLGVSLGELFYEKQFAFCPVPIPEQEDQFILDREKRLPWIDEPKFVEKGGYGEVNKRTVAKGFLRFQNRTTNLEPRAVAVKTLSGNAALAEEFKNLKELRECLSAHTRIMVNLVTMVDKSGPTNIYHIVYELAAYDLNVFLTTMRSNLRRIRHATATPERTGSANMWPGDLISESVNLADALDYLHNRLISSKLHSSLSHNDVKPENILVVYPERTSENELYPVGQWKLADFGLSKMKPKRYSGGHNRHLSADDAPSSSSYPQKTHRTERPKSVSNAIPERYPGMYTAPELDQETPQKTDCRSADVWSFGCVLSEIVTYAVNLDFQQVESFRDSLLQSSPADPKFYNKRSKDVKSEFIDHLARLPNTSQSITRISSDALWTNQCVDLIRKIVVKEPGNRLGPSKIREKLSQIGQAMHSGREEWLKHSPPPPLTVDTGAANTETAVSCPTSAMSQSPTEYTNPDYERDDPITRIPSIAIHPVEHANSEPLRAPHLGENEGRRASAPG